MSRTATAVLISFATALTGCSSLGEPAARPAGFTLSPCDGGPHCVSSQSTDPDRHVDAIQYKGTRSGAQQLMSSIIRFTEGAKIVNEQEGYLHATYRSQVMGFVDDLELLFPPNQKIIELRSSSRIGYYDFGVNRDRAEALRKAFNERQP